MPLFKIVASEATKAGENVRVNLGPGAVNVRIPKGTKTGESVLFAIPDNEIQGLKDNATPNRVYDGKINSKDSSKNAQEAMVVGERFPSGSRWTLFGADVVDQCSEFGLALCLGVAIGISMLVGFVSGILYVTEPLDRPSRGIHQASRPEEILQQGGKTTIVMSKPENAFHEEM